MSLCALYIAACKYHNVHNSSYEKEFVGSQGSVNNKTKIMLVLFPISDIIYSLRYQINMLTYFMYRIVSIFILSIILQTYDA